MTPTKRILLALTSHGQLGDTGRSTGYYLSEAAHPWQVFSAAGYQVDLVSPRGGRPPADGADPGDPAQEAFLSDPRIAGQLEQTMTPGDVDPAAYDAIFYAGGHGTMWDFPNDAGLAGIARDIYESGGVVAAVCHGPAALVDITLSDGRPLVSGRAVTGFSNGEEAASGLTHIVPFLLQDALEKLGAHYSAAADFQPHVVADGRLVTGQNPASAAGAAQAVTKVLTGG
jgi:putative intracellular protease/amidase